MAAILQLLAREDEALLVDPNALFAWVLALTFATVSETSTSSVI